MDKLYARLLQMDADPLPYGIAPNRKVLEELLEHAKTQKILTKTTNIESVFAPATLELCA
jgi:4,5-dihydroxyphthalate decarboxylase